MKQFIQAHKLLCIILACVIVAGAACAVVLPMALKHEHTFSTEWSSDKTNHWHKATCEHTDLKKMKPSILSEIGQQKPLPITELRAKKKPFVPFADTKRQDRSKRCRQKTIPLRLERLTLLIMPILNRSTAL